MTSSKWPFRDVVTRHPAGVLVTASARKRGTLVLCGLLSVVLVNPAGAGPIIAPNPGGSVVVTNSTTNETTFVDTPVTERIDQYSTELSAILNGGLTVFQQTFALPFSDPTVQAAVLQADAVLAGDGATFGNPFLTSSSTALQSSILSFVQTNPTPGGPPCVITNPSLTVQVTTCQDVIYTVATIDTFGPAIILVGDNQSEEFDVLAGQLDLNVNTDTASTIDRNAITTNTFLTSQFFEIDGTTSAPPVSVPEAGTGSILIAGLAGLFFLRRRRQQMQ